MQWVGVGNCRASWAYGDAGQHWDESILLYAIASPLVPAAPIFSFVPNAGRVRQSGVDTILSSLELVLER